MMPAFKSQGLLGKRRAFVLLESMLAVAIFAIGVLALGRCMENCMKSEKYRREEGLAQRALANYWVQIETGALPLNTDKSSEELKGAWSGMTMNMAREPLQLRNEKDQEIFGLYKVTLSLNWKSAGDTITREMSFMIYPRQRNGATNSATSSQAGSSINDPGKQQRASGANGAPTPPATPPARR